MTFETDESGPVTWLDVVVYGTLLFGLLCLVYAMFHGAGYV